MSDDLRRVPGVRSRAEVVEAIGDLDSVIERTRAFVGTTRSRRGARPDESEAATRALAEAVRRRDDLLRALRGLDLGGLGARPGLGLEHGALRACGPALACRARGCGAIVGRARPRSRAPAATRNGSLPPRTGAASRAARRADPRRPEHPRVPRPRGRRAAPRGPARGARRRRPLARRSAAHRLQPGRERTVCRRGPRDRRPAAGAHRDAVRSGHAPHPRRPGRALVRAPRHEGERRRADRAGAVRGRGLRRDARTTRSRSRGASSATTSVRPGACGSCACSRS